MEYRWRMTTQNAHRGDVRSLDPNSPHTRQLVDRGIVEPIEAKVVKPDGVKAKPKRKRKVAGDE